MVDYSSLHYRICGYSISETLDYYFMTKIVSFSFRNMLDKYSSIKNRNVMSLSHVLHMTNLAPPPFGPICPTYEMGGTNETKFLILTRIEL